jgi:hypothetical protein
MEFLGKKFQIIPRKSKKFQINSKKKIQKIQEIQKKNPKIPKNSISIP